MTYKKRLPIKAVFFTRKLRELLLRFNFVATQVLLGFGEDNVLAKFLAVLAQRKLLRSIHRILGCVIDALA